MKNFIKKDLVMEKKIKSNFFKKLSVVTYLDCKKTFIESGLAP